MWYGIRIYGILTLMYDFHSFIHFPHIQYVPTLYACSHYKLHKLMLGCEGNKCAIPKPSCVAC